MRRLKMSKYSPEIFEKAYEIYRASEQDITPLLKMGMNENSAQMTLTWYKKIFAGELYKRSASATQVEFILNKLYCGHDISGLTLVLQSMTKYLNYYRNKKIEGIVKVFKEKLTKMDTIDPPVYPDDIDDQISNFTEGAKKTITVNAYERNPQARKECIIMYGYNCSVCEFNFTKVYGDIGESFIHVHHLNLISATNDEYVIKPKEDLRPVCPNCHAMLHKKNPPYTIDELKAKLEKNITKG